MTGPGLRGPARTASLAVMIAGLRALFRTKSLEQLRARAEEGEHRLRRSLGTFDLTMFGIGAIIGAGIFSSIGTAAAGNLADGRAPAGPALVVSIVLVAVACGFTALAYAEMASMIPVAGSAYTYSYATLGELVAWIIGWDLLLEYACQQRRRRHLLGRLRAQLPGQRARACTCPAGSPPTPARSSGWPTASRP